MKQPAASGFTLIELMIAVVVIAILSAIALPAYNEYLKKAARAEARTILLENALVMEQIFTINNNYNNPKPTLKFLTSPKTGTAKYNISIDDGKLTATGYSLKAVPVKSDKCGTFIIDNTGLRSLENTNGGSVAECWGNG